MPLFSTRSDYAFILLAALGRKGNQFTSLFKIAKEEHLPYRYLSRIASMLKQAGFIESMEGVTGGYKLRREPKQILAMDVLEIMEGGIAPTKCTEHGGSCPRASTCKLRPYWTKLHERVYDDIRKYTLADFI